MKQTAACGWPFHFRCHMRATAAQRGYGTRWQKARATFLRSHPLCAMCQQIGRVTAAQVVDHIRPHRGDQTLFWDTDNWQPLCKPCHDGAKQQAERSGFMRGVGTDGVPIDGAHHWHR